MRTVSADTFEAPEQLLDLATVELWIVSTAGLLRAGRLQCVDCGESFVVPATNKRTRGIMWGLPGLSRDREDPDRVDLALEHGGKIRRDGWAGGVNGGGPIMWRVFVPHFPTAFVAWHWSCPAMDPATSPEPDPGTCMSCGVGSPGPVELPPGWAGLCAACAKEVRYGLTNAAEYIRQAERGGHG